MISGSLGLAIHTVVIKLVFIVLVAVICGCTSMQPLIITPQNEQQTSNLAPGDRLQLVTRSGEEYWITVSAVTGSAIISQDAVFQFADLASVKREELSAAGKAGVLVGVGILVFATFELIEELIKVLFVDPAF